MEGCTKCFQLSRIGSGRGLDTDEYPEFQFPSLISATQTAALIKWTPKIEPDRSILVFPRSLRREFGKLRNEMFYVKI